MSVTELTIEVERREETGKNANRRLRARGRIPAVLYGGGRETVPIEVDKKVLHELFKKGGGEHAIFLLQLAGTGKSRHALIRDLAVDPVSRQILHIDFLRIAMDQRLRIRIPVELVGVPTGVKNEGGILDFITREVEVEALPRDLPENLPFDVSELHVGQHLEVKSLSLPEGLTLITDPDRVLVAVAHPRMVEVVEEEAPAGEELLEAEREEPEVIRRGKTEEEAGAEED